VGVCVCFSVHVIYCVSERVYSSKNGLVTSESKMHKHTHVVCLTTALPNSLPPSILCSLPLYMYLNVYLSISLSLALSLSLPPSVPTSPIPEIFHHKLVDETYTLSPDGTLFSWSKDLKFQRSVKCNETKTVSQAVMILECQLLY
jgi:hypothetical protein